jgi:hypothetical protein
MATGDESRLRAEALNDAIGALLRELLQGPAESGAYVLNPGDRGLLASLDGLSAEGASIQPEGRASVAAHVDHLRYGFSLLNRWARGEDPWADANYAASWKRQEVTDQQWDALRQALAAEARAWQQGWAGAIRQVAQSTSGPPARD